MHTKFAKLQSRDFGDIRVALVRHSAYVFLI